MVTSRGRGPTAALRCLRLCWSPRSPYTHQKRCSEAAVCPQGHSWNRAVERPWSIGSSLWTSDGPGGMLPRDRAPSWPPQLSSTTDLQNINKLQINREIRRIRVTGDLISKPATKREAAGDQAGHGPWGSTKPPCRARRSEKGHAAGAAQPYAGCSQQRPAVLLGADAG